MQQGLGAFSPPPDLRDQLSGAFVVSQGLDCLLARTAEDRWRSSPLPAGCPGPARTASELSAQLCADLPPELDPPPELDELELLAVDQLRRWGQAYPLESVERVRAQLADGSWEGCLPPLMDFQQVRAAVADWDAEGAMACAETGLRAATEQEMPLLSAQFVEAMAFAEVLAQRYDSSKALFERARRMYADLEDPYYLRRLDGNHSALHDRREFRREEAKAGAERALEAFIATGDIQRTGRTLIKQAMNAYHDYELDAAESLARAAVEFGRRNDEPTLEGEALIALGHTLLELGDALGATAAYRAALERFSPQGAGRLNWLNAFSALIDVELRTAEVGASGAQRQATLAALDEKVNRAEAFVADLSPEQWVELKLNHARIKLGLGRPAQARVLADQARQKIEGDGLSLWLVSAILLSGDIDAADGDFRGALAHYRQAERASQASGDLTQTWTAILGLASVYQDLGDREEALAQLGRAAEVVESLWRDVAATHPRGGSHGGGSATFLESQITLYDRAVETLLEGAPTAEDQLMAWWWLERRRSNELKGRLGQEADDQPPVTRAAEWMAQVQRAVATDSPGGRTVVLEYHLSRELGYAFVIDGESLKARRLPMTGAQLGDAIAAAFPFLDVDARSGDIDPAALEVLSQAVLGPVAADLSPGDALRIIPDGRLAMVPFEILTLAPGEGGAVVDRHPVAYDTSASALLLEDRHRPPTGRGVLSVALSDALPAEGDRPSLPPLPCAETESRLIADRPSDLSLRGSDATEGAFREAAPRFDILHLATHGVMEEGSWRRSHLALLPDDAHDGRLTLEEIARMSLGARLAVLPSCRSAVAHIFRGEGIQGIGSAFRDAGVPSTVVGLWELPDVRGTTELVARMLAYVRAGLGQGEALVMAKRDVRAQGASPRVWAPLVLYGEAGALGPGPIPSPAEVQLPLPQGDLSGACRPQPLRDLLGDLSLALRRLLGPLLGAD